MALLSGGSADQQILETASALARRPESGRLILVSTAGAEVPPTSTDGLRVEYVSGVRDAAGAAEAQASSAGAGCLIVPSWPRIARPLFRHAPCPLLFVPRREPPEGPILVPVDFSRPSREAARFALTLGRPVLLLHVYRVPLGWHKLGWTYAEFARRMEVRCRQDMADVAAELNEGPVETALEMAGDPASCILHSARTRRVSCIVLASPRRTWAAAALPGVAERVALNAEVPVWVLRDARPMSFLEAISKG